MNDILTQIVTNKRSEIAELKKATKISEFEAATYFERKGKSLKARLTKAPGIITEFKRKSPSEQDIHLDARVQTVVRGYEKAGAAGISVLTDNTFFGGNLEDLESARQVTDLPILRKDFVLDEIQIFQAKAHGADVVLLIAEILEKEQVQAFAQLASDINLEVLLEVHSEEQLEKLADTVDMVGVNNRNLETFEVDVQQSIALAKEIPNKFIKVSESGFDHPDQVMRVHNAGYQGFLIGSHFMRESSPSEAAKTFIENLTT